MWNLEKPETSVNCQVLPVSFYNVWANTIFVLFVCSCVLVFFLKEMAILAKIMHWVVPLAIYSPKEFSRQNPLCFSRNPPNSVSLCEHGDLLVWNLSHACSLSRTFESEMLLSFLVISPEKKRLQVWSEDLKAWHGFRDRWQERDQLAAFWFCEYLEAQILPEGRTVTGKCMMLFSTDSLSGRTCVKNAN